MTVPTYSLLLCFAALLHPPDFAAVVCLVEDRHGAPHSHRMSANLDQAAAAPPISMAMEPTSESLVRPADYVETPETPASPASDVAVAAVAEPVAEPCACEFGNPCICDTDCQCGPEVVTEAIAAPEPVVTYEYRQQCGPSGCSVVRVPVESTEPTTGYRVVRETVGYGSSACSSGSCGVPMRRGLFGRWRRR